MKSSFTKSVLASIGGLLLLAFGSGAQANLVFVLESGTTTVGTVSCVAGTADPACEGFVENAGVYSLSTFFADTFILTGSATQAELELDFLNNTLLGLSTADAYTLGGYSAQDATALGCGSGPLCSFTTDADYFGINLGADMAFFQNNAGPVTLDINFESFDQAGSSLNYVSFFSQSSTNPPPPPVVPPSPMPEPGALALMGLGLFAIGLVGRRRKS